MSTKKKKLTFITPRGVAVYPRLQRPDTRYHELGVYKADIRIPVEEAKPLLKELGDIYRSHLGQPHPKLAPSKDKEAMWFYEQDEDGDFLKDHVILKIRARNIKTKTGEVWDRKPKLFDAKGRPIKANLNIGGGTVMKVSFEVDCYTSKKASGVRLIPVAVQIIDLVTFEAGGSAEDYGFAEEDGFVVGEDDDDNDSPFVEDGDNNNNNDAETKEEDEESFY